MYLNFGFGVVSVVLGQVFGGCGIQAGGLMVGIENELSALVVVVDSVASIDGLYLYPRSLDVVRMHFAVIRLDLGTSKPEASHFLRVLNSDWIMWTRNYWCRSRRLELLRVEKVENNHMSALSCRNESRKSHRPRF